MSRAEFTKATMREAYARSGGICECHRIPELNRTNGCGGKLGMGNAFYEHIIQAAIKNDNSLENCAVLTRTCWREKTAKHDLPVIAKNNRVRDGARGIRKTSSFATNRDSKWKRRMDGRVERR